jgi:hypothetical protein
MLEDFAAKYSVQRCFLYYGLVEPEKANKINGLRAYEKA